MRTLLVATAAIAAALSGCVDEGPSTDPVATQHVNVPGPWVFEPRVALVMAGEPVTFTNRGGTAHTVTFASIALDDTIRPGDDIVHTFAEPGTYAYVCKLHPPDMKGTLIVVEG